VHKGPHKPNYATANYVSIYIIIDKENNYAIWLLTRTCVLTLLGINLDTDSEDEAWSHMQISTIFVVNETGSFKTL